MAAQNDWPLLSEAHDRLHASAIDAAYDIIGRGQVPVTAFRSDVIGRRLPERIETLLARARLTIVRFLDSKIIASFDCETGREIFGPLCSVVYPEIRFSSVRVRLPELVEALAAAGCAVSAARSQRRGGYRGELKAFMKRFKPEALASWGDDDVALRFIDHVDSQVKAGRSALKLPQLRHVANQVSKLRSKDLA